MYEEEGRLLRLRQIILGLPSLLGIDRRIAYANKKYHSGLMCGVFQELRSGGLQLETVQIVCKTPSPKYSEQN
jgi:hypothetical protein